MNYRELAEKLAPEIYDGFEYSFTPDPINKLEDAFQQVALEARREAIEECAKIADSVEWCPSAWDLNEVIAKAIRARGES